jgi:thioesterase domain-containing protein
MPAVVVSRSRAYGAQLVACRAAPQPQMPDPMTLASNEHLLSWLDAHYRGMPPVAAMDVAIAGYDGEKLRLTAPLSHNVNDKGCAFGGSLSSLMTLAAWGVVTLRIQSAGMRADVFVADSQVRYLAPLYADLEAEAEAAPESDWHAFLATLAERGRARTELVARVGLPEGGDAATFRARFVAFRKG